MSWREQLNVGELTVNELVMSTRRNTDQSTGLNISASGLTYGIKVSDGAQKFHCHNRSTQSYAMEVKYDWQAVTGLAFGIDCTCEIEPGGSTPANRTSGGLRAVQGHARLQTGFTSTGGTDIGVYANFTNLGTINGASTYPTGLYGIIGAGGTWTQVGVLSVAWLDSHLATTPSAGSSYFLNITNNAAAVWDAAVHVYAGNKITNFVKIDTASGMVSANTVADATFANWKAIKIDLDGTTHYLIAAQTIS